MGYPNQPNDGAGAKFMGVLASISGFNKFVAWRGVSPTQQHGEDVADLGVQDTVAQGKLDTLISGVDGLEGMLGATNDSPATSDTATSGLNGLWKRALQHLTSLITQVTSTNTKLDTLIGHNDGMETLATATNTKLDTLITNTARHSGAPLATAVSVGTAPTPLPALAGRRNITIHNNGTVTIYVGGATVTVSAGLPVRVGTTLSFDYGPGVALYAVSGAAGQDVRVLEVT